MSTIQVIAKAASQASKVKGRRCWDKVGRLRAVEKRSDATLEEGGAKSVLRPTPSATTIAAGTFLSPPPA